MSNSSKPKNKTKKPASIVKLEQEQLKRQKEMPANTGNMDDKQAMSALKQHGGNILFAIAVALAGFFGWTYYQQHHLPTVDTVASDKFIKVQQLNEQVQTAKMMSQLVAETNEINIDDKNKEALAKQQSELTSTIDSLLTEHKDSIFTWEALMLKARGEMDSNDYKSACKTLEQARAIKLHDAGLQALTTLRLGQALLANGEHDKAMKVANVEVPRSFEATQQELLGDIYLTKGDKNSAIRSYENAWSMMTVRKEPRDILALKLENLGITPEPIDVDTIVATAVSSKSAPSSEVAETKNKAEKEDKKAETETKKTSE